MNETIQPRLEWIKRDNAVLGRWIDGHHELMGLDGRWKRDGDVRFAAWYEAS